MEKSKERPIDLLTLAVTVQKAMEREMIAVAVADYGEFSTADVTGGQTIADLKAATQSAVLEARQAGMTDLEVETILKRALIQVTELVDL